MVSLANFCRICAQEDQTITSMFLTSCPGGSETTVADVIFRYASVQADKDDGLPQGVCCFCRRELERLVMFMSLCERTDSEWRVKLRPNENDETEMKIEDFNLLDLGIGDAADIFNEVYICEEMSTNRHTEAKDEKIRLHYEGNDPLTLGSEEITFRDMETVEEIEELLIERELGERTVEIELFNNAIDDSLMLHGLTQKVPSVIEKLFQCLTCLKTFSSESLLKKHTRVHSVDAKPYKCEICEKQFLHESVLNYHLKSHTNEIQGRLFECGLCEKKLTSRTGLNEHLRIHTGEKPFACPVCKKRFRRKDHLDYHQTTHIKEKPYKCNTCNKYYANQTLLARHEKTHTEKENFVCDKCGKVFKMEFLLDRHRRIHTGEKPFTCRICMRSFAQKPHLIEHTRMHTGEKPFKCKVCNRSFAYGSSLSSHVKLHTGEKPYQCEVCGKPFIGKPGLRSHQRVHEHDWKSEKAITAQ